MYTEKSTYIYQSFNYTEEVRQCIQKRYLYIPINQLHRGDKTVYSEEVSIYTNQSITQMKYDSAYITDIYIYQSINYRGGRTAHTEEVPIYTNISFTQRRWDSVYTRGTYIYQSINYTEEIRQFMHKRYLYIPIIQLHKGSKTVYTEEVPINTNQSITQRR